MVKRFLITIIFAVIFLVACRADKSVNPTDTNSSVINSTNSMTTGSSDEYTATISPSLSSTDDASTKISSVSPAKDIPTVSNNMKSNEHITDFIKYNGWWYDPEFIDDDVLSNCINLDFSPQSTTAALYIIVYGPGDRLFDASATVLIDEVGFGEFSYEDGICGIKGTGKIFLHEKDIMISLNITTEDKVLSEIYRSERTFIRDPHEGEIFPDSYELLSKATGYQEGNGIEFVQNVSESEGYKIWISVISIIKDGNEIKTYKVNTLKRTVEEYNLE